MSFPRSTRYLAISGMLSKFFASQNLPQDRSFIFPSISPDTSFAVAHFLMPSGEIMLSTRMSRSESDGNFLVNAVLTSSEMEAILSYADHIASSDTVSTSMYE